MAQAPGPRQGLLQHALFGLPDPVLAALVQNLDLLIAAMEITDRKAAMQPLSVAGTYNGETNPPSSR